MRDTLLLAFSLATVCSLYIHLASNFDTTVNLWTKTVLRGRTVKTFAQC